MRSLFVLLIGLPIFAADPAEQMLLATAKGVYKDLQVKTLPNGLQVAMLPIPGSPVVSTMLAYKVGACDEAKDQTGLSHYLEHLLFKGTDKLVPGDIDRITQKNGGRNNAFTFEDGTVYHFDFAADRWMTALEIEAERMRNTRVDTKHEFEQEKGAVIAELKKYEDTPWDLEHKAILPLLFGRTHPYGHPVIGEEDHVRGATAEVITRYYNKWYHPNNATLVIVGGFEPDAAFKKIEELFGKIPKADLPERYPTPAAEPRTKQVRHSFETKFDIARTVIGFNGVVVGDADDYALDVVGEVLTGGRTSRLYAKMVEQEQIASTIEASNNAGRYPGWFEIDMEVMPGKDFRKAEAMLFAEIKKLAETPITEAELKRVRRNMVANYIFHNESTHSLAEVVAKSTTYGNLDYAKTYLEKVLQVTPADVQRAAKKYLAQNSAVVVWSLPAEDLEKAAPAAKPKPPQKAAPASGASGAKLTDAKKHVLKNGLTVILLENHRLPIVVANAEVHDVLLREPEKKLGVAALTGYLLDEGTAKHSGPEIAAMIEDVGGSMQFSGGGGSLQVLTPDTEMGLKLFFECLTTPSFPKDRFKAMQEQLLGEIAAEEAEPQRKAARQFAKIIYGDHPNGRPKRGTSICMESLKPADVRKFHTANFVPNNTTLAIVGDFDSDKMLKMIETLTADWKPVEMPKLAVAAAPLPSKTEDIIISDPTAAQTHIFLGHLGIRRSHPDFYTLEVMDNVLGVSTGFTDRLSSTLRDRQGLAYTVTASITGSADREPGLFSGYIGTFPEKFTWVRDGFLKEIRRIREEVPTDAEVEGAKSYLLGSLAFQMETNGQLASMLLDIDKHKLGFDMVEKYKAAVKAVTPEQVRAAAKKHLDPDKLVIVAVGPIDSDGRPLKAKKGDAP